MVYSTRKEVKEKTKKTREDDTMFTVELIHYKDADEDMIECFNTYEEANEFMNEIIKQSTCYFMSVITEQKKVLRFFCDTELNENRNDVAKIIKEYTEVM